MPGAVAESLWTAAEVARYLGTTSDWVYRQSREGAIPTICLGRYRRYRREAIDQWLLGLVAPTGVPVPQTGSAPSAILRRVGSGVER